MASSHGSEVRGARGAIARRPALVLWVAALAFGQAAGPASAELRDRLLIQGLQDLEFHDTDPGSRLLSRNEGDPGGAGLLQLWIATEPSKGLQGVIVGEFESGAASAEGEGFASLEQAFLRWAVPGRANLGLEAGKIVVPFGNFSRRHLSNQNPLIAGPDAYGVNYPIGVAVTGRMRRLDYTLAVLDGPLVNEDYVPEPDSALRPGVAVGLTPMTGLRFGGYFTRGPYLGEEVGPMLPAGVTWRGFEQAITGIELALSHGYFELNGEIAFSSYEVPTTLATSRGVAWFVEPKYTWTPRFFTALRVEMNDYPFIMPVSSSYWIASNAAFHDVEIGAGWRFTPELLLKGAYRQDHWSVESDRRWMFPDGSAFAIQLSYGFDVLGWFDRPR